MIARFHRIVLRQMLNLDTVIFKYAGDDATEAYDEVHAPGIISESLPSEHFKGIIDSDSIPKTLERNDSLSALQIGKTCHISTA
jgi:hypothetical protein